MYHGFHKNIKQTKHFSILERFLEDYVTLKTGVITVENSTLPSQE